MLMEGFSMVFGDPLSIVLVAAGTLIGTIFGAIPGLTATMAVTICLPMTFAMSDNRAIALLMALYIGGISGGLVSSILLNIPGTPACQICPLSSTSKKNDMVPSVWPAVSMQWITVLPLSLIHISEPTRPY